MTRYQNLSLAQLKVFQLKHNLIIRRIPWVHKQLEKQCKKLKEFVLK